MATVEEERANFHRTMACLKALAACGEDVEKDIQEERQRHRRAESMFYRRAHPDRIRATMRRYYAAHTEEKKKKDDQYRKERPECGQRAKRRWAARRKILQEFMAIDESIFQ